MPTPRKRTQPNRDWFTHLPDDALIREAQVASTDPNTCPLVNAGSATFRRWVAAGVAPKPLHVTKGFTAWRAGDLRAWLASMKPAEVA